MTGRLPNGRHALASWGGLVRNFSSLAGGETVARAFGLIAVVVMTRKLGPSAFGLVTLGTTLVLWFQLIVNAGTETLNVRDIAREPARFREFAEAVLGLRLVLSLVAAAPYVAAVWFIAASASERTILLLFGLALPVVAANIRLMVLGINRSISVAAGNVVSQLLFVAGVLLWVHDPDDAVAVPLVLTLGELLFAAVVFAAVAREFGILRPRLDLNLWRQNIREGWPLMATQISRAVILWFDLFLIGLLLGPHDAGLYGAAYKPVLFFSVIAGLFFFAFLASYSAADPARARELFRRAMRLSMLVTVPTALVLTVAAHPAITISFGGAYGPAAPALAILAWTIVPSTLGGGYAMVLVAANRQSTLMWQSIAGAVFNVVVNIPVVPLAGIEGAAVVTLASYLLVLVLNYRTCARLDLAPSLASVLWAKPKPLLTDP